VTCARVYLPYPGYNFRSTEINAVIGLSQLPRLDAQNEVRRSNFKRFLDRLDGKRFLTEFDLEGNSNYAFILILRNADDALRERLMTAMKTAGVEFRRGTAGGGNQLRQPYLTAIGPQNLMAFPNVVTSISTVSISVISKP
jgi:CDP-6-deoxy-D-xylo-4-hexulose-3-dehydrase